MNVSFVLLMLMQAAIIHTAAAQCGGNLNAVLFYRHLHYNTTGKNNNAEGTCTWLISPDKAGSTAIFLGLTWEKFDVKGKMPSCSDYVEVFLTRSYNSIGKYCSDNMVAKVPFDMYSYDGHAKIVLYSNSRNETSSFSLNYAAFNSNTTEFPAWRNVSCFVGLESRKDSNILVTSGWPYGYSAAYCYTIYGSSRKNANGIVAVMDLDLRQSWGASCKEAVDVRQSDLTGASAFTVTGRQCGTKKPTYYITTKRYVMIRYLTLKRVSSNRGAAIGYLSYSRIDWTGSYTGESIKTIAD